MVVPWRSAPVICVYQIRSASRQSVELLSEIAHRMEMFVRYGASNRESVEVLQQILRSMGPTEDPRA